MRLIDADALKERIQSKYTFAIASEIGYEIDEAKTENAFPTIEYEEYYKVTIGDEEYTTKGARIVCEIGEITPTLNDDKELLFEDAGRYFTCWTCERWEVHKSEKELHHVYSYQNLNPTTLDDIDDYIFEFYPEEYARIKPILDTEREKSAKNKKE